LWNRTDRLPAFTAPSAGLPHFPGGAVSAAAEASPMGLIIIGMGVIGLFGAMISFCEDDSLRCAR
jgi:hypothetical protein